MHTFWVAALTLGFPSRLQLGQFWLGLPLRNPVSGEANDV